MADASKKAMVRLRDLRVTFKAPGKTIRAVSGVDLEVAEGEVVALIGESGSGKSVTLRSIMRLHPGRTRIEGGLEVDGRDVLAMTARTVALRGDTVAMIFQEPCWRWTGLYRGGADRRDHPPPQEGLGGRGPRAGAGAVREGPHPSPERRLDAYPHEMSGGMRQRAMIALALSCSPKVLLADEPTTALDATVQIQILLLLRELQRELGLSIIFVTHDIGAAVEVADRIAVMYAGRIVEQGPAAQLLAQPRHPYTMSLLQSRSHGAMQKGQRLQTIPGAPPDLANLPPGCAFAERCAAVAACHTQQPAELRLDAQHAVRCLRAGAAACQCCRTYPPISPT
jgi:peptide/nickel transport system ATP-binding protein